MLDNKLIAVVVPCYNEETQIEKVIKTMKWDDAGFCRPDCGSKR